jgi:DNA repair exonuclease SbcCD ATPase subunit
LKLDITTFNRVLEELKTNGRAKAAALSDTTEQIKAIGEVNFSHEEYDKASDELSSLKAKQGILREQYKTKNELLKHYKNSEYCPTCHRKLDNVDNTQLIADTSKELEALVNEGKGINLRIEEFTNKVNGMKEMRTKYETKNKLEAQELAYEVQISKLREEYKDMKKTLDEYHKNQEAIDANNKIEIELRNVEAAIRAKNEARETTVLTIADRENAVKQYEKEVEDRNKLLEKIAEEEILVKNWKIYLEMVGKDGISKMVLRETLPIINGKLNNILSDVCDFTVELSINNKNEIMFMLCKDGVYSDLSGASGFERTASALALRSVLGSISTLSRPNFFVTDEILGRVAKENYDNMKVLLEKICSDYDFILNITHLDEFKDFCDTQVSVVKENNISRIVVR